MPPKPIEDIDFPDLGNRILGVLCALWAFICDVCLVLWSYVAAASLTMWTCPPFETFRVEFTAAVVALWDYVVAHPLTATAICVLAFVAISSVLNVLSVCLLHGAGAGQRVALRGSHGPYYHSTGYGRNACRSATQSRGTKNGSRYGAGSSSLA